MTSIPIGGNTALNETLLEAGQTTPIDRCMWLASGRDGYMLISRLLGPREWYLPDFICPVVPKTLAHAGNPCIAYRPGSLQSALNRNGPAQRVVVLAWDVASGPPEFDRTIAAETVGVISVEDRCLWAGMPSHISAPENGGFSVGSCRKWLGLAEGGWVKTNRFHGGTTFSDLATPPRRHILTQLASSAVRGLRKQDTAEGRTDNLLAANLELTEQAEDSLGIPDEPRPASLLALALLKAFAGAEQERQARFELASLIAVRFGNNENLSPGVIGMRVLLEDRDGALKRLAALNIFAPVHWRDGDWCGAGGTANRLANNTLTLPCPALGDETARAEYVNRLADGLGNGPLQFVSSNCREWAG